MKNFSVNIKSEYGNEYVQHKIIIVEKLYSEPKLYIPKRKVKEKLVPSVDKGCRWYVFFRFKDPRTGVLSKQPFKLYKNLNRYKTVEERTKFGMALLATIKDILEEGWNPYNDEENKEKIHIQNVRDAFLTALKNKKNTLKKGTYQSYMDYLNIFLNWCEKNKLDQKLIIELKDIHVIRYLNYLGKEKPEGRGLKATSVDNHKRNLSAIMKKIKDDRIIPHNFIADLITRKNKPEKNAPFTLEEIQKIKEYSQANNPILYNFLRFIFYSFMRNQEIIKTQIKHINLKNSTIAIETKGEKLSYILMIKPMREFLESLDLSQYPQDFYLFTPSGIPGTWHVTDKSKTRFFSEQFGKIREHFKIDKNKTTYSLRHNAAIDLFMSFIEQGCTENEAIGKMLPITRHKTEQALRNYLREIGAIIPKDWAEHYKISF